MRLLSVGVGILIQRPLDAENIGNIMLFIWQTILLTTCIYVLLFLFIGGILMFVVNYILVDKPFRAYDKMNRLLLMRKILKLTSLLILMQH